jgi:sugar lactone lactonase YvrE
MLSGLPRQAVALSLLIMVWVSASAAQPGTGSPVATQAFGQLDLVHNGVNILDDSGLWNPQAVAIDRSVTPNRLYVADAGNHRVLGWRSVAELANGSPADLVFGQADFLSWRAQCANSAVNAETLCSPAAVAVDGAGNLYVADFGNNRVLEYNQPFTTDTIPDMVFGQGGSFLTSVCNKGGITAASLCGPNGVAADRAGNVYIADTANSRVLEYDTPLTKGVRAHLVFGQNGSAISAACNLGGVSANSLCGPTAVGVDAAGNLYVGDHNNFRVLEYNIPLSSGNTTADLVFGQDNSFVSKTNACAAAVGATGLCSPDGLAIDGAGNLYIADGSFSRILEYNTPVSSGNTTPNAALGQANFTSSACNSTGVGAMGLCLPSGVAIDDNGSLYAADLGNNRVVQYTQPLVKPAASLVLGQMVLNQNGVNITKPDGLYRPLSVVVDTTSSPNHIYLSDTNNNRVLGWASLPQFKYAGPPDLIIGQPNTFAGGCNQNQIDASGNSLPSASTLCLPNGLAIDPGGNLYVADSGNFRVLEYRAPFDSGTTVNLPADAVFGQKGSFTTRIENNGGVSADSISAPGGIAIDKSGHLYVSDPANNRVLQFDNPAARDTTADAVFGQGGSFSSNTCNIGGLCSRTQCFTSADSLCGPAAVAVDGAGKLYIADTINNRILVFFNPRVNTALPNLVIGQSNYTGLTCAGLCMPQGLALDPAGDLFAASSGNSTINKYQAPLRIGMTPNLVIGQEQCGQAATQDNTLCGVSGLELASGFLYASDTFNNRVVGFDLGSSPTPTPTATAMSGTPTPTPTAAAPTPTSGVSPTSTPTPISGQPSIAGIPAVIMAGASFTIDGSGFTAGSEVNFFVATSSGAQNTGPFVPTSFAPTRLTVAVPATNPLGQGVVSVQVVNTDRGFLASNVVLALLQGNPAAGIPSITGINAVPIAANSTALGIAVANVETVVVQGNPVTIDGSGFDITNGVAIDLFCACPGGKVGPFFLAPGDPGLTSTAVRVTLPDTGSQAPLTGPGSFVVTNAGSGWSYSLSSNAVSVPIGQQIAVTSVTQAGSTVTVNGAGFSTATVINLFNVQGAGIVNLGGLDAHGAPRIPLTFIDQTRFTFTIPVAAQRGPGYVQALNPPFVPFTSSGGAPGGSFTIE